ncbi:MAG: hypothetical protein SFV81_10490 [Pirellulaceae bacterium]|nr:hypothetical protein [Pirellulaceae bacterium]
MKRGVKKPVSPKKESQPVQRQTRAKKVATGIAVPAQPVALLSDVRELIQQAREGVARAIDLGLVMLYWPAYSAGCPEGEAGGVRIANCRRTGATIGVRVWTRILRKKPAPYDTIRRSIP